jgi:hypothetical protein
MNKQAILLRTPPTCSDTDLFIETDLYYCGGHIITVRIVSCQRESFLSSYLGSIFDYSTVSLLVTQAPDNWPELKHGLIELLDPCKFWPGHDRKDGETSAPEQKRPRLSPSKLALHHVTSSQLTQYMDTSKLYELVLHLDYDDDLLPELTAVFRTS